VPQGDRPAGGPLHACGAVDADPVGEGDLPNLGDATDDRPAAGSVFGAVSSPRCCGPQMRRLRLPIRSANQDKVSTIAPTAATRR
jgi:hypothetical protein